jgi:hypothetical protein
MTTLSQSTKRKLSLLQLADELGNVYSDNLDEKGATIWMRSLVSRQTHHDGRFARPQACCLAICRAATPLRWF